MNKLNKILYAFDEGCLRLFNDEANPFASLYSTNTKNWRESALRDRCVSWVEELEESACLLKTIESAKEDVLKFYAKISDPEYSEGVDTLALKNHFTSDHLLKF